MSKNIPNISSLLLWDYDIKHFDWNNMQDVVVQRVVERGWPSDWKAMMDYYGEKRVAESIKRIPYLSRKDMQYVITLFDLNPGELKCYTQQQSKPQLWNS